jgi:hypothetical protein
VDFIIAVLFKSEYNSAGVKQKKMEIFSPLFETYSIGFISSPLSHSSISVFGKKFDPACPFSVHPSSWPIPIANTWKLASTPCNMVSSRPKNN